MAIKIYDGFKFQGQGLTPAVILSVIADRILKDCDDPISISDICAETAEPREKVLEALQHIIDHGFVEFEGAAIEDAGSIRVKSFRFEVEIDQITLPFSKPVPEQGYAKPAGATREEQGMDEIDANGRTWHAEVRKEGDGMFTLYVQSWPQGERPEVIVTIEDLVEPDLPVYPSGAEAWAAFDEQLAFQERWDTGEHVVDRPDVWWKGEISDEVGSEVKLEIYRKYPDEATSTTVYEDTFEDEASAWQFFDDYVGIKAQPQGDTPEREEEPGSEEEK